MVVEGVGEGSDMERLHLQDILLVYKGHRQVVGGGMRKPQLDGGLRRIRRCVYCHDLDRSHAINDVTKKKDRL